MALLFFILSICGFIAYFSYIWLRYIWLAPIIICLWLARYYNYSLPEQLSYTIPRQSYALYMAWTAIIVWLGTMFHFFGADTLSIVLASRWLHTILRTIAYYTDYQDGKNISQFGYYISIILIILTSIQDTTLIQRRQLISMIWIAHTAIITTIISIVGLNKPIEKYMYYIVSISIAGSIGIRIMHQIPHTSRALLSSSIWLTLVYTALYYVYQYKPVKEKIRKNISVRHILAGEKILHNTRIPIDKKRLHTIHTFVTDMPARVQRTIEWSNIIIVIGAILVYIQNFTPGAIYNQYIYRAIIAVFIANSIILKYINISSFLQKCCLYIVINFAIYLTLYMIYQWDTNSIVGRAIVRNIASSIVLFYAPESPVAHVLRKQDYRIWIILTIIACTINIILLSKTNLPGQLVFSLAFVYIGIQGVLLYYGFKHIQQLDDIVI